MMRFSKMVFIFMVVVLFVGMTWAGDIKIQDIKRAPAGPSLVPDQVLVSFTASTVRAAKDAFRTKYNLREISSRSNPANMVVYQVTDTRTPIEDLIKSLKSESGVKKVEQNAYIYSMWVPNDTYYYPYQWNLTRIGMEDAWELATGSGVIVAVLDSGADVNNADMLGTSFVPGYDFINDDSDPMDDNGHGSHVSATIAQTTNNGFACAGIAYNATIMPVKVLDDTGSGTAAELAYGIYFAVDNGADIINISLGNQVGVSFVEDAVNYAWNNGAVVICSAGNDANSVLNYPAAYYRSMSVSATGAQSYLATYSNFGPTVDICAPGGDGTDLNGDGLIDYILQYSWDPSGGDYWLFSGTSQAAAHVSGVAALVKSACPELTNAEIRSILETTAEDLGDPGYDQYYGNGMVDAYASVLAAIEACQEPDIYVKKIALTRILNWARAEITIKDTDGNNVQGATVSITWSGSVSSTATGVTNAKGKVVFVSPWANRLRPRFTITVTNVTHAALDYDPALNVQTSASI
jgi:serine protease